MCFRLFQFDNNNLMLDNSNIRIRFIEFKGIFTFLLLYQLLLDAELTEIRCYVLVLMWLRLNSSFQRMKTRICENYFRLLANSWKRYHKHTEKPYDNARRRRLGLPKNKTIF